MNRRHFVKTAAGLLVPSSLMGTVPTPLGFFKPSVTSSVTYDSEVLDWIDRVVINGGSVSQGTKDAANTFMLCWKAAGLRTKTKRLNLYAGTGLAACMTPLINDSGTDPETNLNFVSGDYSESTGLTGNGTTKGINTGLNPNTAASTNSIHMGCYVRSKTTDVGVIMGTNQSGGGELSWLVAYGGSNVTTFALYNEVGPPYYDDSGSGVGYYVSSRIASNDAKGYKNGSQILSTTTPSGAIPSPNALYIHCWNDATLGAQAFTSRTIAGYHFGTGFTSTDAANAYTCWQAFQTALGRQV